MILTLILIYVAGFFVASGFYKRYEDTHKGPNFTRITTAPLFIVVSCWPLFAVSLIGVVFFDVLRFLGYLINVDRRMNRQRRE
jgi:uncharacterized membrane protein required for colicin V production